MNYQCAFTLIYKTVTYECYGYAICPRKMLSLVVQKSLKNIWNKISMALPARLKNISMHTPEKINIKRT